MRRIRAPRVLVGFVGIVTALTLARPAGATCTASLMMRQDSPGMVMWQATGSGHCGAHGGAVQLTLTDVRTGQLLYWNPCNDSPCVSALYTGGYSCANPPDLQWKLGVTCGRDEVVDGQTQCVADDPGYAFATTTIDYQPTITPGEAYTYGDRIQGVLKFHAPAAWGDRYVDFEALPSHASIGSTAIGGGVPADGSLQYNVQLPPGATAVQATIVSCHLKTASTFVGLNPNQCQTQGNGQGGCPLCVGHPVNIASGNMLMSDGEPLPSVPGLPLTRTYDSSAPAGLFGAGWVSLFDASFQTFTSHQDTFVMITTHRASRYIFRRTGTTYVQAWPMGSAQASLTYDGASDSYVLREPLDDIESVARAADGVPVAYRSRSTGRQLTISYAGGLPVHVDDSWGHWGWTVTTDAASRLITGLALDGSANTWTYTYSAPGSLLTAVNGAGGAAWRTYAYSNGRLSSATDAAGHLLESHSYDSAGRATTSIGAADDISSIQYQVLLRGYEYLTRVTTAAGAVSDYYHENIGGRERTTQIDGHCSSCGTNDSAYAYDAGGRLVREQDARGYVTVRTFDDSDRMVSETVARKPAGCDPETDPVRCRLQPSALATASLDSTAATATTTYVYGDPNWPERPTAVTTASVANPSQNRTQSLAYDPVTGAVLQETITGWKSPQESTTIASAMTLYDGASGAAFDPGGVFLPAWLSLPQPAGLKRSFDGPRTDASDVTQWVYYPIDAQVPGVLRGNVAAVRDAAGNVTRFESYDAFGHATRVVDPNGVATESAYDAAGRPLSTTVKGLPGCDTTADPLCATDLTTQQTYAPDLGPVATETRPGGGTTSYEYDARGRVTATTRSISAAQSERAEYDYDAATGRKSAERYLSGSTGAWTLARSEGFRYDIYGRLAEIDHPDNTKIYYTYDGANHVASVRDENHTTPNTLYKYDPVGRLGSVSQTLAAAPGGRINTGYTYDLSGNLTSVTDPNGNITSYSFDDFGHLQQQVSPVTGTTTYAYDLAGNLTSTTDANGATTTRTFDALGRVLTATSMCSGSDTEAVNWTYDDPTAGAYGRGRLALMTDPSGSTAYRYERRGLLAREDRLIGDWQTVTDYAYDADGNRVKLGNTEYAYDLAGRPVSAARRDCGGCSPATVVSSAAYLPFGPERQLTFANGTVQSKVFDSRYRILENKLAGPGGVPIADYTYTADATGNITGIHDAIDSSFDRNFTYDDLNRLVTASTGGSLWGTGAYAYDLMGNPLSETVGDWSAAFTYADTTPRIATYTQQGVTSSIQYDAAGNELSGFWANGIVPVSYCSGARAYSCRNLMSSFTGGASPPRQPRCPPRFWYDYKYDGRGVRVHVDATSVPLADYVYTPEMQLRLIRSATDDTTEMTWFNGHPIAQWSSQQSSPRFTFTDHLGTPQLQTDSATQVVWQAEYEPYGHIYELRAGDSEEEQPLRLPGQDAASPTGDATEYYNIFRWYRSGWGRYTQADLIRFGGGINWYAYTEDDPIGTSDPLGLSARKKKCIKAANEIVGALKHAKHHSDTGQSPRDICGMLQKWLPVFEFNGCDSYFRRTGDLAREFINQFCKPPGSCPEPLYKDMPDWWKKFDDAVNKMRDWIPDPPFVPAVGPAPTSAPPPAWVWPWEGGFAPAIP